MSAALGTAGAVRLISGADTAPVRLFLLPYAGGGAGVYRPWSEYLDDSVQAFALQPPGREDRFHEQPIADLDRLVAVLADEVVELLDRPWVVFGHSMGAVLAWALVRRLEQLGEPSPAHLFVSGSRPPHLLVQDRETYRLPDDEFLAELRELNGTPPAVLADEELMRLMMPLLRADFAVIDTYDYTHGTALRCPVTAVSGVDDDRVVTHLERWSELVDGPFDVARFPGDHFYVHDHRRDLAGLVNQVAAAWT